MPQGHGTRRRKPSSQERARSRQGRRRRGGPRPAPLPADPRPSPYGDSPYGGYGPYDEGLRTPEPPLHVEEPRPGRLRRVLTSNVTITAVAVAAVMAAVVLVDLERLSGEKSKPPPGSAGLSANDMLAMLDTPDMDPVAAAGVAAAKKRAYEEHQRDLKALKEKAERDAKARAKLKAQQERERLAKSNPSAKQNKAYGKKMNELKGWGRCWPSLETLWDHESDWNERAENPSSGAYGIPQALPASKLASAGSDWRTSSPTQIAWGLSYIKARYKDPCRAWAFWQSHNWY
ncbi:lytic transglycosylase domain-containing protein [Spirillospora sp. NPDC029432]|uniref:aggregation-promoting factor C-terminal-like domain-containing protein n=1 Tax=Spirillospora sp. NPDC029432 TaxID=3154599 RepID=UPI00345383F3